MDTRQKILTTRRAVEIAANLHRRGSPFSVVSGYFDVLQPAMVISLHEHSKRSEKLFALVLDPLRGVMPAKARLELTAALRDVDYAVHLTQDVDAFVNLLQPRHWFRDEEAHAQGTARLIEYVFERNGRKHGK